MTLQAWHTCIWRFFSADSLKLCQVGWRSSLHSYFQVSPEIGFKSGLWLGLSNTFRDLFQSHSYVILALFLGLLSCWKVNRNLLRLGISLCFAPFIFRSILTILPVPAVKKTSPQHDAATTMLHCRNGARFPPDVMLGIQAKEFKLGFIRPENLVLHGLRVFRCQPKGCWIESQS